MRKLAITASLAFLFISAYFLTLHNKQSDAPVGEIAQSILSDCFLAHQACKVKMDGEEYLFTLSPNGMPALTPLQLEIQPLASSENIENWTLWFEGRTMDMGVHFLALSGALSSNENRSAAIMTFRGMIPVCSVDPDMKWSLHVQVEINDKPHHLIFDMGASPHHNSKP